MSDLKLVSREEISSDIQRPDVFNGEIIPGNFAITETWDFLNWNETEEISKITIKTETNAIFLIQLEQYSPACLMFNVTLTNCSNSYDCEMQFDVINSDESKNSGRLIYHNFTFKKPSVDVRLSIRGMKFNEDYGFINSNTLRVTFTFSHENATTPKRKKKAGINSISKSLSPISSQKSNPDFSDESEIEKELYDTYTDKYCGLRNQGATCYINSILQTLYHIPAFRKVIYEFNCEQHYENYEKTIPWNLQHLFAQMQTKSESDSVSTKLLTNSFGWDNNDIFHQQDIHEFLLKFLSIIESKLKKELGFDPVARLFQGKSRTLIKCVNIEFEYSKTEDFFTIPLGVKDCNSIEESLAKYTEPEHMEGSNQYKAEGYGLQDAILTTKLASLPPVLFFQLRRFEYDAELKQKVKINSKFTFPSILNMSGYMSEEPENEEESIYELFGVFAHAGDVENGHFFVFLRTSPDDQTWFKFNDSLVSIASPESAIEDNFGEERKSRRGRKKKSTKPSSDTEKVEDAIKKSRIHSAYMLVYMQRTKLSELFCNVPNSLIPKSALSEVSDANVQNNTLEVRIYTDESVNSQAMTFSDPLKFEIRKNKTLVDLYEKVYEKLKANYIRLHYVFDSSILGRVLCRSNVKVSSLCTAEFFAETSNDRPINVLDESDIMLFIEFFSPYFKPYPFMFIKRVAIKRNEPLSSVVPLIEKKVKYSPQHSLIAFVSTFSELHEIDFFKSSDQLNLTDGTFVIFQIAPQFKPPKPLSNPGEFGIETRYFETFSEQVPRLADEYYKLAKRSIHLTIICPLKNIQKVEVPSNLDFLRFKQFISRIFKVEVKSSRSTLVLYKGNSIKPLDESQYKTIGEIFHNNDQITVASIDKRRLFLRVILSFSKNGFSGDFVVLKFYPLGAKVEDLMGYVRNQKKVSKSDELRALAIKGAKVAKILDPEELLENLKNPIRIEVVPEDQRSLEEDDESFLAKFEKVTLQDDEIVPFGMPFLFKILPGETFGETKNRIFERLCVPQNVQRKVRFLFDTESEDESSEEEEKEDDEIKDSLVLADDPKTKTQIAILFPSVPSEHKKEEGVKLYD